MKKLFVLPVLALLLVASCKKDYTCTCTTKNIDTSFVTFELSQDYTVSEKNESKAKSACDKNGTQQQGIYGDESTTTDCANVIKK